ncbi:hypothetical protein MSMTP_3244 [Methanosarcina sp. MTP4]|nr:hypothetical protein MSMTP_3244 [Methanosarcina sp. MTP4]
MLFCCCFYCYSVAIAVLGYSLLYISYCTYNIACTNISGQVLFNTIRHCYLFASVSNGLKLSDAAPASLPAS